MPRKLSITLLIMAVFAAVALLGYAQIWAKPPCETTRIFDDVIKVVFKPGCEEIDHVFFKNASGGWDEVFLKGQPVLCTCEGSDCLDDDQTAGVDIYTNIVRDADPTLDVTVECFPVRDNGPASGCPAYLNPDRFYFGGGQYSR